MDHLEKEIRQLFCDTGPLDRDEVTALLLGLLERIQRLEQRQPLNAEQLSQIMEECNFTYSPTRFARAIEAAHGIKE